MKIDFEEIKNLLAKGNLSEASRQTGIAYRTLQDWKLENNKWLVEAEERLSKLQNYIEENDKMDKNLEYLHDFGDYSLYVGVPGVTDYVEAEIRYHENVRNGKVKETLIEKDDLKNIKLTIQEIESSDEDSDAERRYVDDILGI